MNYTIIIETSNETTSSVLKLVCLQFTYSGCVRVLSGQVSKTTTILPQECNVLPEGSWDCVCLCSVHLVPRHRYEALDSSTV